MKIGAIQNSYILPVFTSSKIQAPHIIHGNSYDSFEKAPYSFQNDLEDYYKQLEKNMGIVTENDVKLMAQNVSISTGIDIKDVYKTMGRLSAYSSYKSLDIFKKYFNQNEIRIVSNILPYFEPYNNKGWAPTLTNVMNYILHRNFAFAHDREAFTFYKKALFIDSKFLEIVKNMSDDERQVFNVKFLNKDNIKEIYVEDFENGYNFLNQDESFEKYTIKILNKAKKLQRINGKDINENVSLVLNGKNYSEMKKLGIKPDILKVQSLSNSKQIAQNLNPIIPEKSEMFEILDEITQEPFGDKIENEKFIIDYLRKFMHPVTPQQYCQHLKSLHSKINKYLRENNRELDKVYYLVPSINKSNILVNYQYQKINNIKHPKMIYFQRSVDNYKELRKKLPKNSTVIILDDTMISGLSYLRENFVYETIAHRMKASDNIEFVLAPIFATNYGINKMEVFAKEKQRENADKVIYDKVLPQWDVDHPPKVSVLSYEESPYMTSFVLPYMGPDSNCEDLIPLYQKFLYWYGAQKPALGVYD